MHTTKKLQIKCGFTPQHCNWPTLSATRSRPAVIVSFLAIAHAPPGMKQKNAGRQKGKARFVVIMSANYMPFQGEFSAHRPRVRGVQNSHASQSCKVNDNAHEKSVFFAMLQCKIL
ncbi:MAG: hypothetical protein ACOYMG_13285 [Candidatus Methylumidiphilus sp.]